MQQWKRCKESEGEDSSISSTSKTKNKNKTSVKLVFNSNTYWMILQKVVDDCKSNSL